MEIKWLHSQTENWTHKDVMKENVNEAGNDALKSFKTSNHLSLQNKASVPSSTHSPLIALTSFTSFV